MSKHMTVKEALLVLLEAKEAHLKLGEQMHEAYGGAVYPMDFLVTAVLNRSMCLISGFAMLIEHRNLVAAAPLLRMQLDNGMRLSAAWQVSDPHQLAMRVLAGDSIRTMADRSGKKMTDQYLADALATEYPWIPSVYEHTSGYVHLSDKHIFNAIQSKSDDRAVTIKISDQDSFAVDDPYLEAIGAFIECTKLVLRYSHGWVYTKDHPEVTKQWQKEAKSNGGLTTA